MVRFLSIRQIYAVARKKKSTLAVKGSGPNFQVIILQNNYGGQDS